MDGKKRNKSARCFFFPCELVFCQNLVGNRGPFSRVKRDAKKTRCPDVSKLGFVLSFSFLGSKNNCKTGRWGLVERERQHKESQNLVFGRCKDENTQTYC